MAEAPIKRKRLENLDVLKGIAIIAVVVGHLAAKGSIPFKMCYSFHMSLFIFISGFLTVYTKGNRDIIKFTMLTKRTRRILVPHVCWCSIYIVVTYGLINLSSFFDLIFFNPILWFLLNLFLYDLTYVVASNKLSWKRNLVYLTAFMVMGGAYYLTKDEVFKNYVLFFPFFYLGLIIGELKNFNKFTKLIPFLFFIYPLSMVFYTYGDEEVSSYAVALNSYFPLGYHVSFALVWLNSHMIIPFLGICFYFFLSNILIRVPQIHSLNKILSFIGMYTLQIYVMHYMLFFYKSSNQTLYIILNLVISITICIIVSKIVSKVGILNEILFGVIRKRENYEEK